MLDGLSPIFHLTIFLFTVLLSIDNKHMAILTDSKDGDKQIQTSFPIARSTQVHCAVLVQFADMSHRPRIQWGTYADPSNISNLSPSWGFNFNNCTEPPADVS